MSSISEADVRRKHGGKRYYGKYRGKVYNNVDPEFQGRILATVPSVLGPIPTDWAYPCSPFAGQIAGIYFVPPIGANVWIEFEEGDVGRPIWTGGFWDAANPLLKPPVFNPGDILLRTSTGSSIKLSDIPPAITLEHIDLLNPGQYQRIMMGPTGTQISMVAPSGSSTINMLPGGMMVIFTTARITLNAPGQVSINGVP